MKRSEDMRKFLDDYEKYVVGVLKPMQKRLKEVFQIWRSTDYWEKYASHARQPSPSPIQRAITRIKRPESALDKILRKPDSFPHGLRLASIETMRDALGGRIIIYFLSGFSLIDKDLRSNNHLEICEEEDAPIAYLKSDLLTRLGLDHLQSREKESGYTGIHYIVRCKDESIPENRRPCFELQVRTLSEDIWGEVEHVLGYKPNRRTSFAVRKQFQIISSQLAAIDEHFSFLFDELSRFQEEVDIKDHYPLNAENLPAVLAKIGMGCAQKEIDGLLKLLVSRRIRTVVDLYQVASPRVIEIICSTYRANEGREPANFEIVANLAAIRGIQDEAELPDIVKAQIEYLKGWEELREEIRE